MNKLSKTLLFALATAISAPAQITLNERDWKIEAMNRLLQSMTTTNQTAMVQLQNEAQSFNFAADLMSELLDANYAMLTMIVARV